MLHKKSKRTIKYLIMIALAVAILWIGIRVGFGVDNPLYNVASDSMVPTLNVGDFVIINHNIPFNKLQVGDIIVFKSPAVMEEGKQETIVHRVANIVTNFHGSRAIVTKGDANPDSMPGIDYPIREENYLGNVTYVVPKLGLITRVVTPPINYILIAILLVIVLLLFVSSRKKNIHDDI